MTDAAEPELPSITVIPDGPYTVAGRVGVVRRRIVKSAQGEALTWQTVERLPARVRVALCRCGHSGNKPMCDGSHKREGFSASAPAADSAYDDRSDTYAAPGITVRDDRSICAHAGFCGNKVSNVWGMVGDGSTAEGAARSQAIAMIERCPSGALTYRFEEDGPDVEEELAVQIGVVDDGPLYVTGGIPVGQIGGPALEVRNRVALCRCGASSNKPYCDGAHDAAGFRDAWSPVP
jgi:CDGSH-type Zn-finger protein